MPEWSNGHAWRACVTARLPWVRIPLLPPSSAVAKATSYFGGRSPLSIQIALAKEDFAS